MGTQEQRRAEKSRGEEDRVTQAINTDSDFLSECVVIIIILRGVGAAITTILQLLQPGHREVE